MKRRLLAGAVILLCLMAAASAQASLRGYAKELGYEYVSLGTYPYEADGAEKPVLWRVLTADENTALLLTEYVIDAKQVIFVTDQKVIENHSFRRISAYAESDLYEWLNTVALDRLLGDDPIRGALIEDEGLGYLHPLTQEQYLNDDVYGFSKGQWGEEINAYPRRQAVSTPYARANGLYVEKQNGKSPYWCVAIKNPADYKFGLVGHNGHISWGAYTNGKVAGLRLALRLDLGRIAVAGGAGVLDDPYTLVYTGPAADEKTEMAEPAPAAEAESFLPEDVPEEGTRPDQADEENAPAESKTGVTVSFIGDCSIGDSVRYKKGDGTYHDVIDKQGYAWPFALVKKYLENDDLTVANLEAVLTTRTAARYPDRLYNLIADPDHVQILVEGSVEIVNTVNNHCMDFQDSGYKDTLRHLENAGILHFGSVYPTSPDGHDDLAAVDAGGIRFGFVGFTYPQESDIKRISNRIEKLRREEGCDVVVVSMHWGREGFMKPEDEQRVWARQLIDAGADLIWGHHPHVLQPIQVYRGKPILFSTGNFTFGAMSKLDPSTGIFQLTYEKNGGQAELKELRVIPCQTQPGPEYRPFEVTEPQDRRRVFEILAAELTAKRGFSGMESPPASFLDSGVIRFDQGQMLP